MKLTVAALAGAFTVTAISAVAPALAASPGQPPPSTGNSSIQNNSCNLPQAALSACEWGSWVLPKDNRISLIADLPAPETYVICRDRTDGEAPDYLVKIVVDGAFVAAPGNAGQYGLPAYSCATVTGKNIYLLGGSALNRRIRGFYRRQDKPPFSQALTWSAAERQPDDQYDFTLLNSGGPPRLMRVCFDRGAVVLDAHEGWTRKRRLVRGDGSSISLAVQGNPAAIFADGSCVDVVESTLFVAPDWDDDLKLTEGTVSF